MIQQRRQTPLGYMSTSAPCQRCGGKGKIIHQPCPKCGGKGMIRHRKTIKVSIPAGIDNGQTISLRAQGNAGKNGGPAGDVIVHVTVKPDARDLPPRGHECPVRSAHHVHAGGARRGA